MENKTKIIVAWELYQKGLPKTKIAEHLSKNRDTILEWIKAIEKAGLNAFLEDYERAKKGERLKRQLDAILKRKIWNIREREKNCCGEKIQYFLRQEYGLKIAVSTIYVALHEKSLIGRKLRKNVKRGNAPKAEKAREVIQMDTVDFGNIFAFTSVDIFSREADVLITPAITSNYGSQFLDFSMSRRFSGYVNLIQTDGGPEFCNEFKLNVLNYCNTHRVARPYKKNEQAYIESFNRTLRAECLGWNKYKLSELGRCQERVEIFLKRYHYHRPHMGLGMKPPLS